MRQRPFLAAATVIIVCAIAALACNLTSSGDDPTPISAARDIETEILDPTSNTSFKVGEPVVVQARVSDPDGTGVTRVELLANNIVVDQKPSQNPTGDKELTVNLTWDAPIAPGNVTLLVRPFRGTVRATGATLPVTIVDNNLGGTNAPTLSGGSTRLPTPVGGGTAIAPTFNPVCRARIDVNRLNFRSSPTTEEDNIIGYYLLNDEARVLGRLGDNSWYRTRAIVSNTEGWIYGPFTTLLGNCSGVPVLNAPATPTPTATPTLQSSAVPGRPDLVALTPSGLTALQLGQEGSVRASYNFTIQNIGATATTPFDIRIIVGEVSQTVQSIPALGPGQVYTYPQSGGFEITFSGPGTHRIIFVVDSNNSQNEVSEDNNTSFLDVIVSDLSP